MKLIKEFKEFAMRGNVVDLAVGIIIGAEFGKIVNSAVNDLLMPPLGQLLGGVNFNEFYFALDGKTYETLAKAKEAGGAILAYGAFIQSILNFLIIAAAIFFLVKLMNKLKKEEKQAEQATPPATPVISEEVKLLQEIRDLLKSGSNNRT